MTMIIVCFTALFFYITYKPTQNLAKFLVNHFSNKEIKTKLITTATNSIKDVNPTNRFLVLKEKYKEIYALRDMYYVTKLFLSNYNLLDKWSKQDYYCSDNFYHESDHKDFIESQQIFERISFLHERKCLFSLNVKFLLDSYQIHRVYELNYNHTDKQRIFKLFDYLPSEYSEEIKNLCIEDEDLSQLCELVFVSYIDIMYLRSMCKDDDERYKHKFSVMETYFKKKLDSLKEYYTYKPLTTFDEYNQRRIKMNLLSNIDKLILRLPEEEVEKILRLKSIRLEILNITDGTSQELIDKIQREINFILEMYEKSLEEKVNKDNIETKAFYNYLTYISNDTN